MENVEILFPKGANIENIINVTSGEPFNKEVIEFVSTVSKTILSNKEYKKYPELIAMAYWMRPATIQKLRTQFEMENADLNYVKVPRGLVFHIAPSNVDTLFIYSWFISLLIGNTNIVRVSSKTNDQIDILLEIINKVCTSDKFESIKKSSAVVRYQHDDQITQYFSKVCNMRVIWGGDDTIKKIRSIELNPTASEIAFPSRFSYTLINTSAFNNDSNKEKVLKNFYNDSYWFDQNACSSPRLIIWQGKKSEVTKAKKDFWALLEKLVQQNNPDVQPATVVNKLLAQTDILLEAQDTTSITKTKSNLLNILYVKSLKDINREAHCGGGLFYETEINEFSQLQSFFSDCDQTLTVYGFDVKEIKRLVTEARPRGISRVVGMGQALNFSTIWDGFNLLDEFSRKVEISL